jgi:putative NADH-flavin reductase
VATGQKNIPKDLRAVSAEEQYAILADGKTQKDYLAAWNMRLGDAAAKNKKIVDELVAEKRATIERSLKAGGTTVDIDVHAHYLMQNARLQDIPNKDALYSYVALALLQGLEEYRKASRLKFTYLVKA